MEKNEYQYAVTDNWKLTTHNRHNNDFLVFCDRKPGNKVLKQCLWNTIAAWRIVSIFKAISGKRFGRIYMMLRKFSTFLLSHSTCWPCPSIEVWCGKDLWLIWFRLSFHPITEGTICADVSILYLHRFRYQLKSSSWTIAVKMIRKHFSVWIILMFG